MPACSTGRKGQSEIARAPDTRSGPSALSAAGGAETAPLVAACRFPIARSLDYRRAYR